MIEKISSADIPAKSEEIISFRSAERCRLPTVSTFRFFAYGTRHSRKYSQSSGVYFSLTIAKWPMARSELRYGSSKSRFTDNLSEGYRWALTIEVTGRRARLCASGRPVSGVPVNRVVRL